MPTEIECRVQGTVDEAVPAVTELFTRINAYGGQVGMKDPEAVAAGDGWILVWLPEDDRANADAILNSMLDQIPGARNSIRPEQPSE